MKKNIGIGGFLLLIIPIFIIFAIFIKFFSNSYTYARYEEVATAEDSSIEIANYVVKTGYETNSLSLGKIEPSDTPYTYTFTVSNNYNAIRTDVNIDYDLSIVTTTNLPLSYKLYLNNDLTNDIIIDRVLEQDEDESYFLTLKTDTRSFSYTANQTHTYTLEVTFPEIYKDSVYQDIEEFVLINIDSKQRLSSDSSE